MNSALRRWRPSRRIACLLALAFLVFMEGALLMAQNGVTHGHDHSVSGPEPDDPNWTGLVASMMKMHEEMSAIERTGNVDADFVRLMLPHHQAAVEMARIQLLYGKDSQMRRLAQEIISDQQLEIELMQLWLKQQPVSSPDTNAVQAGGQMSE